MSLVTQEIPKVGLAMEAVRVTRWLKNVGDTVTPGEPLVEVETEKSVIEIEATVSGSLAEVLVQVGEEANVGDPIARIESDEAQSTSTIAAQPTLSSPTAARPVTPPPQRQDGDRVRSSPAARKLANAHGLDIGTIAGSGPRGRVQLEDIRRAIGSPIAVAPTRSATPVSQALPSMRRALARAMTLSNATVPQFTVERSVDWTVLQALRAGYASTLAEGSARLSVNDFLLQAVARALMEFPALNATFQGDPQSPDARIELADGAHIGLVVAVENGLLVPVIHHVERLGLAEIARRREDCVERALAGRLKREEVDGATFSISNLGARGPDRFTAIINPPHSAILAVGRQRDCAVVKDGEIRVRPLSELTLTADHRVADGRLASDFLARLVEILEAREWRLSAES